MRGSRMTGAITSIAAAGTLLLGAAPAARAETLPARGGQVVVPDSSIEYPDEIGVSAHTNLRLFVPTGGMDRVEPPALNRRAGVGAAVGAPASGYYYLETPASLGCVYNLVAAPVAGCNPYAATVDPAGGARAIAIVDAYDDPTAAADLAHFSTQFGLATANFSVVYASGTKPAGRSKRRSTSNGPMPWRPAPSSIWSRRHRAASPTC